MNDVIDQVNTEEDLIYDIVDDIISTENRISELTNKMLINDDSGPGLAKFNLKHDIIKNISTINSLTSQIEDSKIKFKSAKAEHELQIKQIEEESKTIENKIKSIANIIAPSLHPKANSLPSRQAILESASHRGEISEDG